MEASRKSNDGTEGSGGELKESFKEFFLSLPDPTSIMTPEGRRIDTNYATERLFKRSREEIIGARVEELYAQEDTVNIRNALEECKHTEFGTCEATCIRGDNTTFPATLSFTPLKDKEGNIINVLISATDITDLKKKEKELDDARTYSEGIIAHIADALCAVNNDGEWLVSNSAMTRITGYSEEELLGKRTLDQPFLQLPECQEATRDMWRKVEAGEIALGVEIPWVRKDGKKIIVSCSEQSLKNSTGNVIGRILTARDITDLKRATAEVAQALGALSEGDLTRKVDVSDLSSELKEMGENINKSINALDILIKETKSAVQVVSSTSQSLSASTEELNASTNQISGTVAQVAQGAGDQAKQVEEIRKATADLEVLSRRGASEADSAAVGISKAVEVALAGSKSAQDAIDRMAKIFNVSSDSAAAVKSLGELIEEIGIMVDMITNIADQTNLLSLNAAIEAARAGEQGRAFAVVAEEVKKLARESKESAGEIVGTVKRIESERARAVNSMDVSLKEVAEGEDVINASLNALNEIAQLVQETSSISQVIFATSHEQNEAIGRVKGAIEDISAVAEQNAAGAEEASASSEEEVASVEELTATAQELADMAENLNKAVANFRIT